MALPWAFGPFPDRPLSTTRCFQETNSPARIASSTSGAAILQQPGGPDPPHKDCLFGSKGFHRVEPCGAPGRRKTSGNRDDHQQSRDRTEYQRIEWLRLVEHALDEVHQPGARREG